MHSTNGFLDSMGRGPIRGRWGGHGPTQLLLLGHSVTEQVASGLAAAGLARSFEVAYLKLYTAVKGAACM